MSEYLGMYIVSNIETETDHALSFEMYVSNVLIFTLCIQCFIPFSRIAIKMSECMCAFQMQPNWKYLRAILNWLAELSIVHIFNIFI